MIAKVLGYQGIPTTRTVRECRHQFKDDSWGPLGPVCTGVTPHSHDDWDDIQVRERTVVDPIYVVPQMLPCPECEGCGAVGSYRDAIMFGRLLKTCPRCLGSGVVAPPWPDYIATEQWLTPDGWRYVPDAEGQKLIRAAAERRQVVAYKVTATEQLPVAHWRDELPRPNVSYGDEHPHGRVWVNLDDEAIDVTDEPWAADLTPGQVVWRLHLEAPDQPYTEMVIGHPESTRAAVPLSVPVGEVTEIELVDPKEKTDG